LSVIDDQLILSLEAALNAKNPRNNQAEGALVGLAAPAEVVWGIMPARAIPATPSKENPLVPPTPKMQQTT
jgi:hypothetical protein